MFDDILTTRKIRRYGHFLMSKDLAEIIDTRWGYYIKTKDNSFSVDMDKFEKVINNKMKVHYFNYINDVQIRVTAESDLFDEVDISQPLPTYNILIKDWNADIEISAERA